MLVAPTLIEIHELRSCLYSLMAGGLLHQLRSEEMALVYNFSLACTTGGAELTLDLVGGKVGSYDQAEYFVEAPALAHR